MDKVEYPKGNLGFVGVDLNIEETGMVVADLMVVGSVDSPLERSETEEAVILMQFAIDSLKTRLDALTKPAEQGETIQ